ncbi:Lrp/AsnC family transcriptional regulator [Selenomonas sp. WCT3]|uniref:siroheme decarboxylase subunit beta n=1 Tax=Selenomonas sp. WCT3 TaxID=3158785 RepID=UPI0009432363
MAQEVAMTELDKKVIRALQGDFPLVSDPYQVLADQVGISKEDFLACVKKMEESNVIRKMGAVLRHREVGFRANVLVAWAVPAEQLDEIAKKMAASPSVSHCYDRNTAPDWPYNLYTMVHGHSREECERIVEELGKACKVYEHTMLYSKKEWKKTSMRYFMEK